MGDREIVKRVDHFVLHGGEEARGVEPVSALLEAFLGNQTAPEHGAVQQVQRLLACSLGAVQVIERGGGELHTQGPAVDDVGNTPFARPAGHGRAGRLVQKRGRRGVRGGHRAIR